MSHVFVEHFVWSRWTIKLDRPVHVPVTSCPCEMRAVIRFLVLYGTSEKSFSTRIWLGMKLGFVTIPQSPNGSQSHFSGDTRVYHLPKSLKLSVQPMESHGNSVLGTRGSRFSWIRVLRSNRQCRGILQHPKQIWGETLKIVKGEYWTVEFPFFATTPDITRHEFLWTFWLRLDGKSSA